MFELKKVEYVSGMSFETHCYSADLYLNGVRVADVGNAGHGGCDDIHFTSAESCLAVEAEILASHAEEAEKYGWMTALEFVCCRLMNDWLAAKELRKLMSKRVLWTKRGEPGIYQTQAAPRAAIRNRWVDEIAGSVDVDIVLNNEPFADALKMFKERT